MARIREGMSEAQVEAILGKPDDIRTERDPGRINLESTKEIWGYGTDGHLTFPTLGSIHIDEEGKVQYVFGGRDKPPDEKMFAEEELRGLLRLLDRAPGLAGSDYNPLPVIQIVNALQPLGKDKALAAIEEYLRVSSPLWWDGAREGQFLIMRVLFDVPEDPGYMPVMRVGAPMLGAPKDPKTFPRFPLVLEDDIPFLPLHGYLLAGHPEDPGAHVAYFRKHGTLRDKPLKPSGKPLDALHKVQATVRLVYASCREEMDNMLLDQALRLMDTVYRPPQEWRKGVAWQSAVRGWWFAGMDPALRDKRLKEMEEAVGKLDIRWDGGKNVFTLRDGSTLPPVKAETHPRWVWKPETKEIRAYVVFERIEGEHVSVDFQTNFSPGGQSPGLRVLAVKDGSVLAEIPEESGPRNGWLATGTYFDLAKREEIQAELKLGETTILSPVYRP